MNNLNSKIIQINNIKLDQIWNRNLWIIVWNNKVLYLGKGIVNKLFWNENLQSQLWRKHWIFENLYIRLWLFYCASNRIAPRFCPFWHHKLPLSENCVFPDPSIESNAKTNTPKLLQGTLPDKYFVTITPTLLNPITTTGNN